MTPRMVLQSTPDKPTPGGLGAGAKTREVEGNYWSRQVLEALHIHRQQQPSNLDGGLAINPSWLPLLNKPSPPKLLLLCTSYKYSCHPYNLNFYNYLISHHPYTV